MTAAAFLRSVLLDEVEAMYKAGVQMHLLAAMAQGIEVCGAFLDPLPYKSKGQGRKRFQLAIRKLFPKTYAEADRNVDLYGQLRSHISHALIPGKYVLLSDSGKHLSLHQGVLTIHIHEFYQDHCAAVRLVLQMLESGALKEKRLDLETMERILNWNHE